MPPYLRLVVPSACWNASKIMRCLSAGMPMPVSVTEKAITFGGRRAPGGPAPAVAAARCQRTCPCSVNLNALDSRFLQHLLEALRVGDRVRGRSGVDSTANSSPFCSATWRKVRSTYSRTSCEADVADVHCHRAGLDLRQVEDVVDQREQVGARRVDGPGELDLLVVRLPSGLSASSLRQDQQLVERRAQLVRHVGQELATCTCEVSASCSAFSSSAALAPCSISRFLRSTSAFCSASSRAFSSSSSLVCCSCLLLLAFSSSSDSCSDFACCSRRSFVFCQLLLLALQLVRSSDCDCLSSSSVRMLARDGVEHDADRLGELVEEGLVDLAEPAERGQLDHRLHLPSNSTGSTTMLSGAASPSAELILM